MSANTFADSLTKGGAQTRLLVTVVHFLVIYGPLQIDYS